MKLSNPDNLPGVLLSTIKEYLSINLEFHDGEFDVVWVDKTEPRLLLYTITVTNKFSGYIVFSITIGNKYKGGVLGLDSVYRGLYFGEFSSFNNPKDRSLQELLFRMRDLFIDEVNHVRQRNGWVREKRQSQPTPTDAQKLKTAIIELVEDYELKFKQYEKVIEGLENHITLLKQQVGDSDTTVIKATIRDTKPEYVSDIPLPEKPKK